MASNENRENGERAWHFFTDVLSASGDFLVEVLARAVGAVFDLWS